MTFIETVADDSATGATAELYAAEQEAFGFLPNFVRAFSLRPEVYFAWKQLNGAVKGGMDLRRYELVTIAAASRLRSSYCTLAHGSVLIDKGFLEPDAVRTVVSEHRGAGLDETDDQYDRGEGAASDGGVRAPRRRSRRNRRPVRSWRGGGVSHAQPLANSTT